ncbi:MAG: HIT domain-containing protein [Candidatus Moranbacteria bacterium]|nr:HIT domain-containing protein [Candidatus Moranbacteria bacterium]
MDFEKLKIKDYKHWELYLHDPHYYLGSVYLWAKRDDEVDFLETTEEERKEFFEIARDVKKVLVDLFDVNGFNIANLQNKVNHLHVHIIPRYSSSRTVDGFEFVDENWGKMFYPYDEEIKVPETTLLKIVDEIKSKLK